MDGWIDGCVNESMDEGLDGWNGWLGESMHRWMDRSVDGQRADLMPGSWVW